MAAVQFSVSTQGARDYRDLAAKIRKAARRDLRVKLREKIKAAGDPVVAEVKSVVATLPVKGTRGGGAKRRRLYAKTAAGRRRTGLRRSIAAATRLQITAKGVRFVVNSNRLPPDQQTLPRHLDNPKGWRHPVFGNKEQWVHQQGKPYFAVTIKRRAPQFRQAIFKAIDEIKAELER